MATRLYFLVARATPMAVVFRRGPTRQVELLRWDLRTDELVAGQWLKGRIYERRSDLSPSGDLLIYFAAKYAGPMRTWTAISRPPYLTALALWPKQDAWGGGGLFEAEGAVLLNHRADQMELDPAFSLARRMRVSAIGEWAGHGEDHPIIHQRLVRDGWRYLDRESKTIEAEQDAKQWLTFDPPIVYRRPVGRRRAAIATLELAIEGFKERDGSWYVQSYRVLDGDDVVLDLGRADWADAAPNGDILLAREGRLLRMREPVAAKDWATAELHDVADLNGHVFERRESPVAARRWR